MVDRSSILRVRGLRASYGKNEILQGIDFDVSARETVVLLGANGCGKTTALNVVTGFLTPSAGEILFEKENITGMSTHQAFRRGIVQVSQKRDLFPEMSVEDNLKLGGLLRFSSQTVSENLEKAYSYFPRLRERRNQKAQTLSGGEQQMVAIGRALLSQPKMLILDEPSGGLAPRVVEETGAILGRIKQSGMTILMVEQHLGLATRMADRFYILRDGQVRPGDEIVRSATSQEELVRRIYF